VVTRPLARLLSTGDTLIARPATASHLCSNTRTDEQVLCAVRLCVRDGGRAVGQPYSSTSRQQTAEGTRPNAERHSRSESASTVRLAHVSATPHTRPPCRLVMRRPVLETSASPNLPYICVQL